jgi:signal transduction histidine kinase
MSIKNSAQELLVVLNDILDYSKIELDHLELSFEPVHHERDVAFLDHESELDRFRRCPLGDHVEARFEDRGADRLR